MKIYSLYICISYSASVPTRHNDYPTTPIGLGSDLTRSSCQTLCAEEDYPFYGMEWSIRCACGGKETTKDKFIEGVAEFKLNEVAEACDMPCAGDETETCGGQEAFAIWET